MQSTGIVRRVDELGRVGIPKEIRSTLGIHESDPLEISVDTNFRTIVMWKYDEKKAPMGAFAELLDAVEYVAVKHRAEYVALLNAAKRLIEKEEPQ